jgi:nucleoside-specific outer membrane channel protein Tsx
MKKNIALVLLAAMAAGAQAADWSSNTVGYRRALNVPEPSVAHEVDKNILSFTHVSGDKLGSNLFTIDLLKSAPNDPANGTGSGGAQEWYGFYQRGFSLTKLTGKQQGFGFFKDISLTARVDAGAKNTQFAPSPFKLRPGVSFDMPVSAGFWNVGVDLYKENNHTSFNTPHSVRFDTTWALGSAWSIPVTGGTFGGFVSVVGPKGKDGAGVETKTETWVRTTYMTPIGSAKSDLEAGVGLEYISNKFGCDNSLQTGTKKDSCTGYSPLLLVQYKL